LLQKAMTDKKKTTYIIIKLLHSPLRLESNTIAYISDYIMLVNIIPCNSVTLIYC